MPTRPPLSDNGQQPPRWRRALAVLGLALAASLPALAQTLVTNGQTITANGSYKIPDGVGTVTFEAVGGGGGGGGAAGTTGVGGAVGGRGGNGVSINTTYANAGGKTFAFTIGNGGSGGSAGVYQTNGQWCGGAGSDGQTTEVKYNSSQVVKAANGSKGTGACTNGGTSTSGTAGLNGNCSNPWSYPAPPNNCTASTNGGSGGANMILPGGGSFGSKTGFAGGAGSVKVSWTMAPQTITCPSLPRLSALGTATTLAASSSLASATFSYSGGTPGVCTIGSSGQLTPNGWGTCSYTVNAAGNAATNSATQICTASVMPDYAISGTVAGLVGAGVVASIANNGTQIAQAGNNQPWIAAADEGAYNIAATAPGHTCQATNGSGTLTGAPPQSATGVAVTCTPDAYSLSGTITGAAGPVELRVGSTPHTLTAGSFTLASALGQGSSYPLSVTAPANQSCTVTPQNTGMVNGAVSGVQIACGYPLRVAVSGLNQGRSLVLQNNGADDRTFSADGTQSFGWVPLGNSYAISVHTPPQGQTCTVGDASISASGAMSAGLVVPVTCISTAGGSDQFDQMGTWTVPPGVTSVRIEMASGGGSGGGGTAGQLFGSAPGGAGGNGMKATVTNLAVTPGETFRFVVGSGGALVAAGSIGNDGGTTTLFRQSASDSNPLAQNSGGKGGGRGTSIQNPGAMFPTGVPGTPGAIGACTAQPAGWTCSNPGGLGGPGGAASGIGGPTYSSPGGNGWITFTTPQPTLASQSITCGTASKTWGDADFGFPAATVTPGTAGGPTGALSYGSVGGACTEAGGQLHITGAGTCTYGATAAGIAGVLAPATQSCTVLVAKAGTSIAIVNAPTPMTQGTSVALSVTPTPALATGENVTFASTTPVICAFTSSTLTAAQPGTCIVTATRSGNANLLGSTSDPVSITVAPRMFTVSGTVTGVVGGQAASVSNSGGAAQTGGSFSFSLAQGASYNITATVPHHTCMPLQGSVTADVSNLQLVCTPEKYNLSGSITGLTGSVTLQLGSFSTSLSGGSFTFSGALTYNQPYDLIVQPQPADQTCTVSANGKGDHATGNVTGVVVTCVDLGTQAIACNAPSKTWGDADFAFPEPGITTDPVGQTAGAVSFSLPLTTPPPSVANACELSDDDPADPQPPKLRITSAGICKYDVKAAATSALKEATQACEVTVDKKILALAINGSAPMLTGDDLLLSATFDPAAPTGASVTWASGNQGICTVDASGLVTALAQGTCSITATWAGDDNHAAISASASIPISLPSYTVSGAVTGLVGGQTASVSDGTTTQGGSFSFSFSFTQGASYSITATASHHTCAPLIGGPVTADVPGLQLACTPAQYSVGGTVTGLPAGTTATVSLGGATPQTTNSAFNFASSVAYHSPYSVSATATGYTCTPATGTVSGDVTNAQIACTAIQYSLAYTVSGLGSGNTVVLSLGGVDKPVAANGSGSYADALTHGQPYALTVKTQPTGQTCTVASGSGTASADVSGVAVVCDNTTYPLTGAAQPAIGGSVACPAQPMAHGGNAQCTATANAGWRFQAFDAASACTRTSGTGGATCEIDDVQAARTVTAQFEPWFTGTTQPASGAGGTGTATFSGGGDTCSFDAASTAFVPAPASLPQGKALPQGLFQFKLVGCTEGSTVTMHVTWPQPLGSDYLKHGFATPADKDSNTRSYFAPDGLMVNGSTATFTVTDGVKGDDDWAQDGTITDPSGGAQPAGGGTDPGGNPGSAHPVPTLGAWGALLLPALVGLLGLRRFKAKIAASA